MTGPSRTTCTVDKAVKVRLHQASVCTFRDIASKGHALPFLIYGEDRAHHWGVPLGHPQGEWEEQSASRESGGVLAEVLLIEFERRSPIHLEKDIALGSSNQALGPELIPPTERAVTNGEIFAV